MYFSLPLRLRRIDFFEIADGLSTIAVPMTYGTNLTMSADLDGDG